MNDQPPPEGAPAGPLPDATGDEGQATVRPPEHPYPGPYGAGPYSDDTKGIHRGAPPPDWNVGLGPIRDEDLADRSPFTTSSPGPGAESIQDAALRLGGVGGPATKGIPRAENKPGQRALLMLQSSPNRLDDHDLHERVAEAAWEVSTYHAPVGDQVSRHLNLSAAVANFLVSIVENVPAGPERSTAISRAREAKMWASAGVALEPRS